MTTRRELAEQNPNFPHQYQEWRQARAQNGEDPNDYAAFRNHLLFLGAPDPGEEPPVDWAGFSAS